MSALSRKWPLAVAVIALLTVILVLQAQACGQLALPRQGGPDGEATLPPSVPPEMAIIWETWQTLKENHVNGQDLDPEKLSRGAVQGMLEALGDPYAAYLDPQQFAREQEELSGTYEGIGAQVDTRAGRIIIVAPFPGSPAEAAGIRPGDIIVEIEGKSTEGLTLQEAISQIRGPRGTSVRLGIRHLGSNEIIQVTVVRDVIRVTSVEVRTPAEDVGYVRLSIFRDATKDELVSALRQLEDRGVDGIVLDLRDNPGGFLGSVVDVASQFLRDGLVLYEVDGQGHRTDWEVRGRPAAPDIPLVVLVNQYSASASEVLAGALRDHGRAKLVGTKTFGKGSVNTFRTLSDGSGIYFTIAHWYTPNGTLIEGNGLEPDVVVEPSQNPQEDPQLVKAIEVLRQEMGGA